MKQQPKEARHHISLINALIAQRQILKARNEVKFARNNFPKNTQIIQLEQYLSRLRS